MITDTAESEHMEQLLKRMDDEFKQRMRDDIQRKAKGLAAWARDVMERERLIGCNED